VGVFVFLEGGVGFLDLLKNSTGFGFLLVCQISEIKKRVFVVFLLVFEISRIKRVLFCDFGKGCFSFVNSCLVEREYEFCFVLFFFVFVIFGKS